MPRRPCTGGEASGGLPRTARGPPQTAREPPANRARTASCRAAGTRSTPGHTSPTGPRCSITCRVTAALHRLGDFLPSTCWGPGSCPERRPQTGRGSRVRPAQPPVESWTKDLHRLWTKQRSTGCARSCPRTTHRLWPVVPNDRPLLHMVVHCSATLRPRSPCRVKAVTPRCRIGVWETWVNLGTQLGRTALDLWVRCAELSVLHRDPELSTGVTHRVSGQNSRAELGKRGYPRYPQALLLLPTSKSAESVSKRVLCTTRALEPGRPSERLDPDRHLLSVRCVRLVPGAPPVTAGGDTESEDSVATAGGGLR